MDKVTKSLFSFKIFTLSEAADVRFIIYSLIQVSFELTILAPIQCSVDNVLPNSILETACIITDKRLRKDQARLREMMTALGD